MNDKSLHSSKKAERSVSQVTTMIIIIVELFMLYIFFESYIHNYILYENFHLTFAHFFNLMVNDFTLFIYFILFILIEIDIIPFIYDFWGIEMIFISNDYLTIDKHALFLHKTKTIKISNIVDVTYTGPRKLPDFIYFFQNEYKVKIKYYGKHLRLKWMFNCGMNFSAEEYVEFEATLKKLIKTNKNNI